MNDYIERMEEECKELEGKCSRLTNFFFSEKARSLSSCELYLMNKQRDAMLDYIHILMARIDFAKLKTVKENK